MTLTEAVATNTWDGPVASCPNGDTLHVAVAVEHRRRVDGGFYETTDHGAIPAYDAVTVTWWVVSEPDGVLYRGQPDDAIIGTAVPFIPAADFHALVVVWMRWSGRSLSPGCAHQSTEASTAARAQMRATGRCELGEYEFGSRLLVRTLPRDVVSRLDQIGAHLTPTAVPA